MRKSSLKTILVMVALFTSATAWGETPLDSTRTYQMQEVVVTGSNVATGRNLLPYTVTTIDSSALEAAGPSQLLSAISVQVPSLFVSERNVFGFGVSSGGSGAIKIRGVGGSPTSEVLMMVDGQPQFAGIYSHHVADAYEKEYVERVEVLRGPGSVLYGSNAMGGVINVITKNADRDGIRTTLSTQYGSYNTSLSSITNTMRFGKFSSLISLGYDRTDGTEDDFDFKQGNLYAKVGYDFSSKWKAQVDYSLMKFVGNDPIYATLSDPSSTDIYHQNIVRGAVSMAATNHYKRTDGSVRVYYSYGNHFIEDPNYFHSLDDRFGILLYQNFHPWRDADATVGFDFDTYSGKIPVSGGQAHTEGSMSTISRKSTTEYSPYVSLAQHLFADRLMLNAGLRMSNSNRFGTHWIPQGGIVFNPGKGWTIRGSIAKGYRNPSFRELYLYRTANADLDPEDMVNYEIGVAKVFSRYLTIDVTAYYSKGDNLIQTVNMQNQNTGSFTNKGFELSASSRPTDRLTLRASYSYLHTSLDNLTAAPENQYFLGVGWRTPIKLQVDAELRGVGGLYVSDDWKHEKYALLNLKLSYPVVRFLDIFCTLNNITNTSYTINNGYEMPGITAMGGVKIRI